MKILLINQHMLDWIGGSEIQCDLIASYLLRFGHQVYYGVVRPNNISYKTPYSCIRIQRPFFWFFFKMLIKIKPHVIYWRFHKNHLLYSTILCKILGVKFVFGTSSILDYKKILPFDSISSFKGHCKLKSLYNFMKYFLKYIKRQFKHFVNFYGFYFVDLLIDIRKEFSGILPVKKEIVIYNSMLADKISFKWQKPYIAWVANLKPNKNPKVFTELADSFRDYDVDFLMIGRIQHQKFNYVKEYNQKKVNFHYLGIKSVEEVNGVISSSLFLVHTCDPEGFGNIFIQAWLQGKPVVSLYFDPDSIMQKNKIGFLSESFEKMISDVRKLIEDDKLRDRMGNTAKTFAEQNFNPKINIKRLEKFLLELTGS